MFERVVGSSSLVDCALQFWHGGLMSISLVDVEVFSWKIMIIFPALNFVTFWLV